MIKIFVLSLFVFVISFASINAQIRRTPKERAQMLKDQLSLTDSQTTKIENIYIAADKKFQESSQGNFDRSKFRAIMDSTNIELKTLLNDKQKDAFDKFIEERRGRMRGNKSNSTFELKIHLLYNRKKNEKESNYLQLNCSRITCVSLFLIY